MSIVLRNLRSFIPLTHVSRQYLLPSQAITENRTYQTNGQLELELMNKNSKVFNANQISYRNGQTELDLMNNNSKVFNANYISHRNGQIELDLMRKNSRIRQKHKLSHGDNDDNIHYSPLLEWSAVLHILP